jgi:hypothetical protein
MLLTCNHIWLKNKKEKALTESSGLLSLLVLQVYENLKDDRHSSNMFYLPCLPDRLPGGWLRMG